MLDAVVGPWHAHAHMDMPPSLECQMTDTAELLHMTPSLVDLYPDHAMVIMGRSVFIDLFQ